MMEGRRLTDLSREDLAATLAGWGQPAYRARQIWNGVYVELAGRVTDLSVLPAALRDRLDAELRFPALTSVSSLCSKDKRSRKVLFELVDGETIESVLMRYERRNTVCVSTQVGCAVGCLFCATGQAGFRRDLSTGEIAEQVLFFARELRSDGAHVTNIVFMGMGEPLLNYEATWRAIETLNDPDGFGLGARHMTVSTAGVVPGMDRMAGEALQVGLAVSLHAPEDSLRNKLVPLNRRYPISEILAACRRYSAATGRRVTFEYALIEGVNDDLSCAETLAALLTGMLCHVNLIPANCTQDASARPSPRECVDAFREIFDRRGVPVSVRLARGVEIDAGCGQLRARAAGKGLKK